MWPAPEEETMTKFVDIKPLAPWQEIRSTQGDWEASGAELTRFLQHMHLVRAFEEAVLDMSNAKLVNGPAHVSIGQEAGAVGAMAPLIPGDQVNGSHRGHHQFIAKALSLLSPENMDNPAVITAPVQEMLRRSLAEIMGLAQGYCKGRGGSMHLRCDDFGHMGTNAIVGGGVPMAAGAAWSNQELKNNCVVISFFGDGAINIGAVLETMNLAALTNAPICFFIENNRYAVSTSLAESTREQRLSGRGIGFGIPSFRVDGMDVVAVAKATEHAAALMRAGKGPVVIEAEVYRYVHQTGGLPGSAYGYRTKEEESEWKARDPIERVAREMIARKLITQEGADAIGQAAKDAMAQAVEELTILVGNARQIRPELWPSPDFRDEGVRGDLSEFAGARYAEQSETSPAALVEAKFVDAVSGVMLRAMKNDERIVVLGEDVHNLRGGTGGATKGLRDNFPRRVLPMPISEEAFSGFAGGMAVNGHFRPVVEFMYPDFVWVAADQMFNQIGKVRHMYGGTNKVPLVARMKVGIGTGYGSQHSLDPAGLFATSPGWRIVAPSTPYDYIGLMNSALRCDDPVLVIEHVDLYKKSGLVPTGDWDHHIPFGKAKVVRAGRKLTILSYLSMVDICLEAIEKLGVDVELIDLRSLDRAGIDWPTIETSVRKTNSVLIVEQGTRGNSYGGMLGDELQSRLFDWLDQPVRRAVGGEAAPTVSRVLESAAIVGLEEVSLAIESALRDVGETPIRLVS
jgi:2-oxoisovalerate dehydrogenase E1 component